MTGTTREADDLGTLAFSPGGEDWVEFGSAAARRRIGFHDYGAIYAVPGLYERIFYETLGMRSTAEVVRLFGAWLDREGLDPADQRVIDFGAGNGLGGHGLRELGVGELWGIDLEPLAATAAQRDRPGVYDRYLTGDLIRWSDAELDRLHALRPTAVLALSAVGIGHIPPSALQRSFDVLGPGGVYGFAVTPTLLPGSDDAAGQASGFPDHIDRLRRETEVLSDSTYVHRLRSDGSEEAAYALLGRLPG